VVSGSDVDTVIMFNPELQNRREFSDIMVETEKYEPFVKVIEDSACLVYQLMKSRSMMEASVCLGAFIRSVTGRSNVYFYKDLCQRFHEDFKIYFCLQSDGHWTNTLADVYDNYARCKDSSLSKKLKVFFNHLIMHCVYHKLNIEVDSKIFNDLEEKKVRPNLLTCLTFVDATASLLTFLLKQGRQAVLTGNVEHLFVDSDSLSVWLIKAKKLKMNSEFLGNPGAVGLDLHTYLKDLSDAVKEATALAKFMRISTPEGRYFMTQHSELAAIQNRYLSVTAAQSIRKAPLGLIVHGKPGIGKSSVMTVISDFDARRRGRNTDPSFRYMFSAESEFFDNFTSSQHTIIIDDAAMHNPNKISGLDPTTSVIMRIFNGIGWCPPQAAIENKGKTPMLVNLGIVSTNVHDLNIPLYYTASYAAMRRLKYRITPIVRDAYVGTDMSSLESFKCDGVTAYPDYWRFEIAVATQGAAMTGSYKDLVTFESMPTFLKWLGEISDKHDAEQEMWVKNNQLYSITLCDGCKNPNDMCLCETATVQAMRVIDGEEVYVADLTQDEINKRAQARRRYGSESLFRRFKEDEVEVEEKPEEGSKVVGTSAPDFRDEYRTSNGEVQLFFSESVVNKKWREKTTFRAPQRTCTAAMSIAFKKNFVDKAKKVHLEYYAHEELPMLLKDGWTDAMILDDFYKYTIYCAESDSLDTIMEMAAILVETEFDDQLRIKKGGFWDAVFKFLVSIYFYNSLARSTMRYFGGYSFVRRCAVSLFGPCLRRSENQKYVARKIGAKIDESLGGKSTYVIGVLSFLALGSVGALAYGIWKKYSPGSTIPVVETSDVVKLVEEPEPVSTEVQVLRDFGSIPKPAKGDDKINMWDIKERNVTSLDFMPGRSMGVEGLDKKLVRNSLVFEVLETQTDGVYKNTGILLVLSNQHFVTNSHSIPKGQDCRFVVYFGGNLGVAPKVEFLIKQSQIERLEERDICVVRTCNLPAVFKDISLNFTRESFDGSYDGYYLIKQRDGSFKKHSVFAIRRVHVTRAIAGFYFDMEAYTGTVVEPTVLGDCGAPLVVETGFGPVVVGFHAIYDTPGRVYATKFSFEDFQAYAEPMVVQVGRLPVGDIKVDLGPKSYIDYHEEGTLFYHGEMDVFRMRPKHHVVSSELASQLYGKTVNSVVLEERLCGPVMDGWRAQQVGLAQFLKPVRYMDEDVLLLICETWVNHILTNLPEGELKLIEPYSIDVAVNGMPGMAYVDPIKKSTSMGFPYFKAKRGYLETLTDDHWPDGVKFSDRVEKNIADWMKKLSEGVRLHAIFSSNLKDEAVSFKKFEEWKTRIFFSCPAELLVIVRMFYQGFARVVQRNRALFWVAVGLNTTSPEWQTLFERLSVFGVDTAIAGDHVFYDKKVKMLLLYYVMEAINRVCVASGNYTDEHKVMMEVLKHELMNPSVDFFGMLVTLLGGEVSGHQLTTIFNCIMNIFYIMYAYHMAGYDVRDFFHFIVGVILGDDHVLCVSPQRPLFHHTQIKETLESLGLGYTMADKSSESVPYISLYQCSFLKRTFVYSKKLGVHVGPLEFNSIMKMLTVQVRSNYVSLSEQLAQAITSAMSEAFFYGEDFFNELDSVIKGLDKSESLRIRMLEYPYLSYDGYKRRFWNSVKTEAAYDTGPLSQKNQHTASYCLKQTSILQGLRRVELCVYHARAFPKIRFYGSTELDTNESCKVEWAKVPILHEKNRLSKTNEQTNSIPDDIPETQGSSSTIAEQTQYINETPSEVLDMGLPYDVTANTQLTNAHLARYLSRPAKIATYTWAENAGAGKLYSFNPWSLFFNTTGIKNKLEGFSLMRCKLKVKFTINASQFYYGALGAFYTPMAGYIKDTTGASDPYTSGFQVLNSQKPHVWLDPQTTSNAEMTLPFLLYKNWLNTLSNLEFTRMGTIDLVQYAALRSANGVTTAGVNIVIYAWAEDFELTALTSQAVLQSRREYAGNGQISGPASSIAGFASQLKTVPVIGSFAKATEMAASTVGNIASIFGFTNVPNVKDVEPMKSVAFHTLASSEISEPINKLSLQPKQEISVDGSYAGDPYADQLHITNFCQRESFLCGSLWTTAYAEDTILFTSCVAPFLYEKSTGTNYRVFHTPMSYAAKLFTYWRGDIIFRVKVIKTQYHRGRINICWDAGCTQGNLMPGYGNPNVQNLVFDLEETDEVEVRVPYMQAFPFQEMADGPDESQKKWWDNGTSPGFTGYSNNTSNGTFQVRVINRLTAPEASSDVDILIFVRAADNIEFAGPSQIDKFTTMALQSSRVKVFDFGTSTSDPAVYDEIFGEKIISFRQLLHRQSRCWTQVISKLLDWAGTQMTFFIPFMRVPRPYGYSTNAWEKANGTVNNLNDYPFNYVKIHPITWITTCFIGYKGSVNWTFNVVDNDGKASRALEHMSVARKPYVYSGQNKPRAYSNNGGSNGMFQMMRNYNTGNDIEQQGATGMALTNQYTQTGLSVNLPYYIKSKFIINDLDDLYAYGTQNGDDAGHDWYEFSLKRGVVYNTADMDVLVDIYCGTGPDFDVVFFINCPMVIYLPSPTAAALG
jgi:hypothetical protein